MAPAVAGQSGKHLKIIKKKRAGEPVKGREGGQGTKTEVLQAHRPPQPAPFLDPWLCLPFTCVPVHVGTEWFWLMLPYFCRNRSGFMKMLHGWASSYPPPQLLPLCSCAYDSPSVISITKAPILQPLQPLHLPGPFLARPPATTTER